MQNETRKANKRTKTASNADHRTPNNGIAQIYKVRPVLIQFLIKAAVDHRTLDTLQSHQHQQTHSNKKETAAVIMLGKRKVWTLATFKAKTNANDKLIKSAWRLTLIKFLNKRCKSHKRFIQRVWIRENGWFKNLENLFY